MKIRGEKRFYQRDAYVSRPLRVFVPDECKCIYQEGCSFRDVVRLFHFIRFSPARTLLRREWKFNENAGVCSGEWKRRGGMGDKGVDEALNENAPYFTRLTNADESVTGLNFCREDFEGKR